MSKTDYNIWEANAPSGYTTRDPEPRQSNSSGIDIDIRRILSIWPFILLFGLLGYAVGSIYLRYTNTIYSVSTSVSLEESQEVSIGQALFGNTRDPFNDKVAYFRSPNLAAKLVDTLGLEFNAEAQGRFRNKNFYKIIRWKVYANPGEATPNLSFSLTPKGNGFHYVSGKNEGDALWGFPFFIRDQKVLVEKLHDFSSQSPIYCYSTNRMEAAFNLSKGLEITTTKESNIITIKYSDVSSDRAIDILQGLIDMYNRTSEIDKSQGFSQAIQFIETRMSPLRRELDSIESSLASFKASRGITGTSVAGEMYLQKMQEYDKELTQINILESTINAVENFIRNPQLKDADLAFVGVDNPGLQNMLMQYQQMRQQRDKLALTAQETNPTLILMDKNISDLRSNMEKQLANYKSNLRIAQNTYQQKIGSANEMIRSVPIAEKELMDKTRFQNIKEQLYLTLLQKREEAAIAKASVTVNTKVLSPPVKLNSVAKPSRLNVFVIAILLGMVLPIIFAIIKELLNRKIISKNQLQSMTTIPVLSEIEQAEDITNFPFVIGGNSRSMFGEQIRSLRTSINFYLTPETRTNYVIITSSVSGEGKSFISMNLAKSYSMQGKRVALLEFDLRRPKILKALKLKNENKVGLTSLLMGKHQPAEILISVASQPDEVLDLFPSGSIPPNPQELISSSRMEGLKQYLDAHYDMVVVDTPPFGIVADAQILGAWAHTTLIITRFQQTVRDQVYEINEWNERKLFKSMAIVFNGVKKSGYYGYKYGYYYYKRKYGYNYYSNQKPEEGGAETPGDKS